MISSHITIHLYNPQGLTERRIKKIMGMAIKRPKLELWDEKHLRHSEKGPALILEGEEKIWFWHGELLDVESQEEFDRWLKLRAFE